MAHAIAVRCPHCGASLSVETAAENATCSYCGTTSMLLRKGGPPQPPHVSVIVVRSRAPVAAVVIGVLVAAAVVAAVLALRPEAPSVTSPAARTASHPTQPVVPRRVEEVSVPSAMLEVQAISGAPMVADVDGDGGDDVVARARFRQGDKQWDGHGAWKLPGGEPLWQLASPHDATAAIAHRRLLLLDDNGQVNAYDLATAKPQWSTALGDKGTRFCASRMSDTVEVATLDARRVALDVKTGKQSPGPARAPCAPLPGDGEGDRRMDPRDRHDHRAPDGVVAIRCGSVRVMGSQSYVVEDQCRVRTRVDVDALAQFAVHSMWQVPGGWLLVGVRDPGTHSPVVGVLRGGKLAWKADVPEGNPLAAREGGPDPVILDGAQVIVGHAGKQREGFLSAYALDDGVRRWHVALPGGEDMQQGMRTSAGLLVVARGKLLLVSPVDGAMLRSIGAR